MRHFESVECVKSQLNILDAAASANAGKTILGERAANRSEMFQERFLFGAETRESGDRREKALLDATAEGCNKRRPRACAHPRGRGHHSKPVSTEPYSKPGTPEVEAASKPVTPEVDPNRYPRGRGSVAGLRRFKDT